MKAKISVLALGIICFAVLASGQSASELLQQADVLYEDMKDMASAQEALALYRKALLAADDKYEAYWKISRIMYFIGEHMEEKKDRKNTFAQAVYHAEKAVALQPEKPDGYYWRGVNNGKYGETRGVLKSLSLVKPIKNDMNKVIELDRSYEDGGPDRVLGRVYFKLPGFAGGSKDKSREHLEMSKEYGPQDALTRVYLAETLLTQDEVDSARAELEFVINLPDDPRWVTGVNENKSMAREMLDDKKFRNR